VRLQAIAADGSVRISMTGEALQTGPAPDPPTILSATNQLRLEFDSTTVASWASCTAELMLRVEGRFASGRYFSGDAGQAAAVTLNMQSTPGGIDLWFNSVAKVRGAQPGSHLYVSTGTMAFGATVVAVPAADISFTAAGTLATTSFDPACNLWKISVPYTFVDNIFIAGLTYLLPNAIGNSTPATWTARFSTNTAGLTLQWKGAAAAYPPQHFGDYYALGVKTLHATSGDAYPNGDQAGTPEAFKAFVTSGGTGGGGSNATGGFSGTVSVTPTVK